MRSRKRIVVGISGASGALYAQRLVRALVELGHEVHLTATGPGQRLLHDELGMEGLDAAALAGVEPDADLDSLGVHVHPWRDVGAPIASGSFLHDGMVVVPCSGNTLAAIATGLGDNLLTRAAAVCLKERRPLVIVHRESPLTLIDIDNMRRVTEAGAIVAPANPGLYLLPTTIGEIVDFVVAKTLDLLKIEHAVGARWDGGIRSR